MRCGANAGTQRWSRLQLNGAGSQCAEEEGAAHELTMSRRCVSETCNGGVDMKARQKCIISCEEG